MLYFFLLNSKGFKFSFSFLVAKFVIREIFKFFKFLKWGD